MEMWPYFTWGHVPKHFGLSLWLRWRSLKLTPLNTCRAGTMELTVQGTVSLADVGGKKVVFSVEPYCTLLVRTSCASVGRSFSRRYVAQPIGQESRVSPTYLGVRANISYRPMYVIMYNVYVWCMSLILGYIQSKGFRNTEINRSRFTSVGLQSSWARTIQQRWMTQLFPRFITPTEKPTTKCHTPLNDYIVNDFPSKRFYNLDMNM